MPDITMCKGVRCILRFGCYRFTAKPNLYQSYLSETPYNEEKKNVSITGMMSEKGKAVMMVIGLCHQLSAWIEFSRNMGYMTQRFKQESGILANQCKKFIAAFDANDDDLYEHSVQISELFERIAKMDQEDIKRVYGIIKKIEEQKPL